MRYLLNEVTEVIFHGLTCERDVASDGEEFRVRGDLGGQEKLSSKHPKQIIINYY